MRSRFIVLLPLIGLLVAAVVALRPCTTFACSCLPPGAPDVELNNATAVFAGRVVSISSIDRSGVAPQLQVRFEVSKSWKGPAAQTIEVLTEESSASCGVTFAEGGEFMVYASASEGFLNTSLCSRTRAVADADEDLAALGPASAALPAGITGSAADGRIRTAEPSTPSTLPEVGGIQNPALWIGLGALALVAGSAAAWFVVRRGR